MTLAVRLLLLAVAPVAVVGLAALAGAPVPVVAGLALAAAALAAFAAWRLARSVERPLREVVAAAEALRQDEEVVQRPTGLTECDAAITAIADAGMQLHARTRALDEDEARHRDEARVGEDALMQAQRLQVVGRLAGSVAHDFNNVLGVVSNSLLLLRRLPSVDAHQMPLGALERAAANGTRLVRQLQRLARPVGGATGSIDPRSFLDEVTGLLKTVLGSGIRLVVEVEEPASGAALPALRVDPVALELSLVQLALNAREAMPAGGTWTLRARRARPDEATPSGPATSGTAWVVLEAEDTGEGVEPARLDRLFDRFHTTRPDHVGLGLSQVREAARAAGGEALAAPGPEGRGLALRLLLPAREPVAVASAPADVPAMPPRAGRDRLLLVEDNESLADVTRALLDLEGYDVVHARSAADAMARVAAAGADAFDVVLSDVVMPGHIDGLEMARRLREAHPSLPIVLISGYSASLSGAQEFEMLYKPYAPQDLTRLLRKVIAEAEAARAA